MRASRGGGGSHKCKLGPDVARTKIGREKNRFDTNDAQYDLAWSEINENQLLVACGDGSIKMYDVSVAAEFPVMNFHEHKREAFSVAWSPVSKDTFASSSWDGTVKIVRCILFFIFYFFENPSLLLPPSPATSSE